MSTAGTALIAIGEHSEDAMEGVREPSGVAELDNGKSSASEIGEEGTGEQPSDTSPEHVDPGEVDTMSWLRQLGSSAKKAALK